MKVKLSKEKAISTATLGVSAAGGALVSKGAMSIAPESFKKPIVRTVVSVLALVGASVIQGKGTLADGAKGLALGVGIQQGVEAVAGFVKPTLPVEPETKVQKFIDGAFKGLNGAEDEQGFYIPNDTWQEKPKQVAEFSGFSAI